LKIRTKLSFEAILLIGLVGMVSLIGVLNTNQVKESFLELSNETMPVLDSLKDMRWAAAWVTESTTQILLLEETFDNHPEVMSQNVEERIEGELFELENAKALFTKAFTEYSILIENYPETYRYDKTIAKEWNDLIMISSKMISMKSRGAAIEDIVDIKEQFDNSEQNVNQVIHLAIAYTGPQVSIGQEGVESIVNNTTTTILVALNIFIISALSIRYFVMRSISNPLSKIRKTATEIANGNFVKSKIKGNDEITELGQDIDKMSDDLKELNKEIISSERLSSIGSLASRLAHDLRNPLSVIKNATEILNLRLNPNMDEKVDHQLAMVGRAISRMSHQIEDVLDFVNVADLKVESSSIITIIESAALGTVIPKQIKVNLPKNSVTVICDPYRLEVVLSNLIKNASQAIEGNGEISIRIIDKKDDILIEIEDTGPGIPESELPKIFEPLFTTKQSGTGLGLASCKSIVERHAGALTVRNNPTVFTIHLPKNPSRVIHTRKYMEKSLLSE